MPKSIRAMPTAMSLTRGRWQRKAWSQPKGHADDTCGEDTEPRSERSADDAAR